MKYLVTGAAGFIGSHLVDRLLADGHDVLAVDNHSSSVWTYAEMRKRYKDYTWSGARPSAVFFDMNVSDFCERQEFDTGDLDGIYHLASAVGPAGILKFSGNMVKTITDDIYDMIDLAAHCGCRLLYVSTSEVYGGVTKEQGLAETDPCMVSSDVSVRLEYAVAKLAAEVAVLNTLKVNDRLNAVIIRPFNVAGARQGSKAGFVLPRFVQQALSNQPLTIFGDGRQVRAFTHVADIVDGLVLAMDKGGRGEVYNLGNPVNRTTIYTLALGVLSAVSNTGSAADMLCFTDGKQVYGDLYAESRDKWPNASKAMDCLGWQPSRSIRQTIADVVAYERERIKT